MTTTNEQTNKEKTATTKRIILNSLGVLLCVVLIPILVLNCILIVQGILNPDKVPSIGKYTPMIVLTDSMEDTIRSGDLIICEKIDPKDVLKGDVISFFDPSGKSDSVVTHRVNSIEIVTNANGETEYLFYTQGDNNNVEDILPVPGKNLVGKWTGKRVWALGHVILFTQSPLGLILCVFVPVAAAVIYYLVKRKQKDGQKQEDIDALKRELEALKNAQKPADTPAEGAPEDSTPDGDNNDTQAESPEA